MFAPYTLKYELDLILDVVLKLRNSYSDLQDLQINQCLSTAKTCDFNHFQTNQITQQPAQYECICINEVSSLILLIFLCLCFVTYLYFKVMRCNYK